MYFIALQMLFRDKMKCLLLICALTFSSLLVTQQGAVFVGLLRWATAMLRNTKAKIWVVDPKVEQVNETQPMRTVELDRVRSVEGVKWAMPISFNILRAKMPNGIFKSVQLIGLDAGTLAGLPENILEGDYRSIYGDKTVMIDQLAIERFYEGYGRDVTIGDYFEINDLEARVVAICATERSFFGYPFVFTTFDRSLEYKPREQKNLNYIIVEPLSGYPVEELADLIEEQTGLKAYTEDAFAKSTTIWFFKNTGIPISFGTTVFLGFLVGAAVAGQTFYAFILDNMPHFGVLKAMGANNGLLARMMMLQTLSVGFVGYGLGVGLAGVFGRLVLKRGNPPFFLPDALLVITFLIICFISLFSVWIGMRKIIQLEPDAVFRG